MSERNAAQSWKAVKSLALGGAVAALLSACLGPTSPYQGSSYMTDDNDLSMAASVTSGGTYNVVSVKSGKCVEVPGGQTTNGVGVDQWTCGTGTHQQWKFTQVSTGVYQLVNVKSGKCGEVAGSSTTSGALVQQYTCGTGSNQKWQAVDKGSGQYQLIAQHSGKCMDVYNNGTTDGVKIEQWTCGTGTNQLFKLNAVSSSTPTTKKKVVLYLPDWYGGFDTWVSKLDFSHMTHIMLAFGTADANGNTKFEASQSTSAIGALVTAAHGKGVKVLISIGGASNSVDITPWIATSDKRTTYVNNLVNFVNSNNLDGVDIDLEGDAVLNAAGNYQALTSALIAKLRPNGKLVTSAVAPWFSDPVSSATFQSFDFINIMAYDEYGPDWSGPGNQSPYTLATDMLGYYTTTKGVSKSKQVLGVPFYGYCWGSGCGVSEWSYAKILATYGSDVSTQAAETKDLIQVSGRYISYNGRPTITKKAQLAKGYGGIMAWEYPSDATGSNSLTTLMANTIWAP